MSQEAEQREVFIVGYLAAKKKKFARLQLEAYEEPSEAQLRREARERWEKINALDAEALKPIIDIDLSNSEGILTL